MRTKMNKIITHSLAVLAGLALGIILMGYLSVRASKMYHEALRISIITEQMQLAAQAHKKDDRYSELVHRSNIVSFSTPGALRSMEDMKNTWSFSFPFASLILERIGEASEKAKIKSYAMDLARLAEAMEEVGLTKDAVLLWQESAKILGYKDIEKLKSFVSGLHKVESDAGFETIK
jgi:ribosomal protein S18